MSFSKINPLLNSLTYPNSGIRVYGADYVVSSPGCLCERETEGQGANGIHERSSLEFYIGNPWMENVLY